MLGKTAEEFQQEILKSIKLKNTSVDVYYQQNVYCNFKSDRETPFSVSLNLDWQKIFLFYRNKSEIDNIGEMFPNFSLSKQDGIMYTFMMSVLWILPKPVRYLSNWPNVRNNIFLNGQ